MEGWKPRPQALMHARNPLLAGLCALVLALAPLAAGCGGEEAGARSAANSRPPPAEVMQLALYVSPGGGEVDVGSALQNALVQSGFTVVTQQSAAHDVELVPHVSVGADDSVWQVVKNGQRRRKYTVRLDVTAGARVLGQFLVDYRGYPGDAPDDDAVGTLVSDFAHSARVARYARELKGAAAPAQGAGRPSGPASDSQDDRDWFAVDTVVCKVPATLDACDGVRGYLEKHPHGSHTSEATRVLTQAVPGLERLRKDENSWQKAGAEDCRQKRTRDACIGVEAYETAYPTGLHAEEARRLLGK